MTGRGRGCRRGLHVISALSSTRRGLACARPLHQVRHARLQITQHRLQLGQAPLAATTCFAPVHRATDVCEVRGMTRHTSRWHLHAPYLRGRLKVRRISPWPAPQRHMQWRYQRPRLESGCIQPRSVK
jgi:hypothetical protein